ncbi:dentin sialophosphoprotein-like [Littorina saxatilis]|uniref:dentin sialophosphoprotein-like n=1 Tax=Littorina saxatilis TaxID=31220 RepID=UPI0038B641C0
MGYAVVLMPLRSSSHVLKPYLPFLSVQSNLTSRGGQAYSLTNGSTSRDHSNASSPHHDTDTKPLLLLTANTEGLHPMCSPSASQASSLQFIDEEPRKKRMMAGDDSEATRPLLASTDISANSLLLSPTSSTSGPALSLNGHATHNGGPASLSPNGHALRVGGNMPVNRGNGTAGKGREGPYQQVTDSPSPPHGGGGVLETAIEASPERWGSSSSNTEGNRRKSSAAAAAGKRGSRSSEADRRHSDGETQKGSSPSSSTAERRRSDEDESQTPADSGDGGNVQVPLIRFCGLTQSDSSLTSQEGGGGRSYQYGTQTEYTPPDLGYFSGTEYINGMNSPYQALQLLQSPLLLGSHHPAHSKPAPVDDDCDLSPTRTSPAPGDDIMDSASAVGEDNRGISRQNSLALSDNACKRLPPGCDNHISNVQSAADSGPDGKVLPVVGSKTVSTDPQNPVTNPSVSEGLHGDCQKLGHPNHNQDSQSKSEGGRSETGDTVCDNTLPKSENIPDSGKTQGGVLSKNGTVPSSSSSGNQTETPSHADMSDPNQPALSSNVTSSSVKNVPTHHSNQSYDHGSSQPNIANKSHDTQGDQSKVGEYKSRDKQGDQPQYRRKSTPSNTPETEVVMKRLFSFDGERTTFL